MIQSSTWNKDMIDQPYLLRLLDHLLSRFDDSFVGASPIVSPFYKPKPGHGYDKENYIKGW